MSRRGNASYPLTGISRSPAVSAHAALTCNACVTAGVRHAEDGKPEKRVRRNTGEEASPGFLSTPCPLPFRSYADGSAWVYPLGLHSPLRYVDTPLTPSTAKVGFAPLLPPKSDHQRFTLRPKGTQGRLPPQFSSGRFSPTRDVATQMVRPVCAMIGARRQHRTLAKPTTSA
jgi:hypothetical protein